MRKVVFSGVLVVVVGVLTALVLVAFASIAVLDRSSGTIVSSGEEREYLLHVPPSYDPVTPTPLVISMHGAAPWPAHQMNTSRWTLLADEQRFIVVYLSGSGVPRIWQAQPGADPMADVRFISELIDTLKAVYNIDPARVYANGLSNGGGMAFVLSCALSARIAAVGTVAAAQLTWAENRARRNRCGRKPVQSAAAKDVMRLEYVDCADDAAVVLYTVQRRPHLARRQAVTAMDGGVHEQRC